MKRRSKAPPAPWGRILGTLTAVVVTLVCVMQRIDPLEIVKRAGVSFAAVAVTTALFTSVLTNMSRQPKQSSR